MWRVFLLYGERAMKYTKIPLNFEEQANLILSRGLIADKDILIEKLKAVNYYRLSGYWYPFKNSDDSFMPNATLDKVWQRYTFDRQLRLLVLDAIERVEISVRTNIVYYHSHAHGAFGYLNGQTLPKLNKNDFTILNGKITNALNQSKAEFIIHFQKKYGDTHNCPPIWMLAEIIPFGTMFTFFRGLEKSIKRDIAKEYVIAFGVLESWLSSLNTVRNICAHHGRLWNRVLGLRPLIPDKDNQWHMPVKIANERMFGILSILQYMLKNIAPQSKWKDRLEVLFNKYPDIPLDQMGFPENWKDCPIWK